MTISGLRKIFKETTSHELRRRLARRKPFHPYDPLECAFMNEARLLITERNIFIFSGKSFAIMLLLLSPPSEARKWKTVLFRFPRLFRLASDTRATRRRERNFLLVAVFHFAFLGNFSSQLTRWKAFVGFGRGFCSRIRIVSAQFSLIVYWAISGRWSYFNYQSLHRIASLWKSQCCPVKHALSLIDTSPEQGKFVYEAKSVALVLVTVQIAIELCFWEYK